MVIKGTFFFFCRFNFEMVKESLFPLSSHPRFATIKAYGKNIIVFENLQTINKTVDARPDVGIEEDNDPTLGKLDSTVDCG